MKVGLMACIINYETDITYDIWHRYYLTHAFVTSTVCCPLGLMVDVLFPVQLSFGLQGWGSSWQGCEGGNKQAMATTPHWPQASLNGGCARWALQARDPLHSSPHRKPPPVLMWRLHVGKLGTRGTNPLSIIAAPAPTRWKKALAPKS